MPTALGVAVVLHPGLPDVGDRFPTELISGGGHYARVVEPCRFQLASLEGAVIPYDREIGVERFVPRRSRAT
jgi:hypothetical protein